MAVTVNAATFQSQLGGIVSSGTGAKHQLGQAWSVDMQDSSDDFIFDRMFALTDYSLTTGAGNLDIDLYDLGALDVGAGAGEDNLGLTHANARILAFGIRNQEVSGGGTLRIDQNGAGAAAWTGFFDGSTVLDLAQGGQILAYLGENGKTVTDATDHLLRLSAQTNNCTIDFIFYSKQS